MSTRKRLCFGLRTPHHSTDTTVDTMKSADTTSPTVVEVTKQEHDTMVTPVKLRRSPRSLPAFARLDQSRSDSKRRRQEKSCDRYIPNRLSTDSELIHHLMVSRKSRGVSDHDTTCTANTDNSSVDTPFKTPSITKEKVRGRCLFSPEGVKKKCVRLLNFTAKRQLDFSECNSAAFTVRTPKIKEDQAQKILNAPGASKNFYYNLVDWGANNIVVIGLKEEVYYWDAVKSQAYVLPQETATRRDGDLVTSVKWKPDNTKHVVSQRFGTTKLWDSTVCKLVSSHTSPTVYVSSWQNDNVVTMGRGDGTILHWDIRTPHTLNRPFSVTTGIICGLSWDLDQERIAIGCNENKVQIIPRSSNRNSETLTMVYQSAVKALAWNPVRRGILATGSGQNDQRVVVWDLIGGKYKNCIDTKSQVTGLAWSPTCGELITSHGHFDPNLRVWDLKRNENTCKLTGHSNMIVSIAKSPINDNIMSLSADESLRVWNIFSKNKASNNPKLSSSALSLDKIR